MSQTEIVGAKFIRRYDSLVDLFTKTIAQFSDRDFLAEKKHGTYSWITYKQFGTMVDEARGGLAALGVGKGDRVAIIADNCPEWAVLAFATYTLGAVVVPMYEAQKISEWEFIVNDCQATLLAVRTTAILPSGLEIQKRVASVKNVLVLRPGGEALPAGVHSIDSLRETGRKKPVAATKVESTDLAGFVYTSGTTGNPKGVMLAHQNLADNLSAFNQVLTLDPAGETSLAFLPWAHVFGQVVELYGLFSAGGKIALAESPTTILANLLEIRPTILYSVPRIWNRIYTKLGNEPGLKGKLIKKAVDVQRQRFELMAKNQSSAWLDLQFRVLDKVVLSKVREKLGGRLKYAVSGSAALSPDVARFISYLGIVVSEGYGLTESSPIATYNPLEDARVGTVGKAIPGVTIKIAKTEDVPAGQGEIIIYGHNVMQGYYNRPEENAKVFTDDKGLRTGDLGMIENGYLKITGRLKEQYKLENGKYVAPAPLEEAVKLSPFIASCYIHGMNKPYNVALIAPNWENAEPWAKQNLSGGSRAEWVEDPKLIELIKAEIEKSVDAFKGYEEIRAFKVVAEEFTTENGMLTPTLKIRRRAVTDKYGAEIEELYKKGGKAAA